MRAQNYAHDFADQTKLKSMLATRSDRRELSLFTPDASSQALRGNAKVFRWRC